MDHNNLLQQYKDAIVARMKADQVGPSDLLELPVSDAIVQRVLEIGAVDSVAALEKIRETEKLTKMKLKDLLSINSKNDLKNRYSLVLGPTIRLLAFFQILLEVLTNKEHTNAFNYECVPSPQTSSNTLHPSQPTFALPTPTTPTGSFQFQVLPQTPASDEVTFTSETIFSTRINSFSLRFFPIDSEEEFVALLGFFQQIIPLFNTQIPRFNINQNYFAYLSSFEIKSTILQMKQVQGQNKNIFFLSAEEVSLTPLGSSQILNMTQPEINELSQLLNFKRTELWRLTYASSVKLFVSSQDPTIPYYEIACQDILAFLNRKAREMNATRLAALSTASSSPSFFVSSQAPSFTFIPEAPIPSLITPLSLFERVITIEHLSLSDHLQKLAKNGTLQEKLKATISGASFKNNDLVLSGHIPEDLEETERIIKNWLIVSKCVLINSTVLGSIDLEAFSAKQKKVTFRLLDLGLEISGLLDDVEETERSIWDFPVEHVINISYECSQTIQNKLPHTLQSIKDQTNTKINLIIPRETINTPSSSSSSSKPKGKASKTSTPRTKLPDAKPKCSISIKGGLKSVIIAERAVTGTIELTEDVILSLETSRENGPTLKAKHFAVKKFLQKNNEVFFTFTKTSFVISCLKTETQKVLSALQNIVNSIVSETRDLDLEEIPIYKTFLQPSTSNESKLTELNKKFQVSIEFKADVRTITVAGERPAIDSATRELKSLTERLKIVTVSLPILKNIAFVLKNHFQHQLSDLIMNDPRMTIKIVEQPQQIEATCHAKDAAELKNRIGMLVSHVLSISKQKVMTLSKEKTSIATYKNGKLLRKIQDISKAFVERVQSSKLVNSIGWKLDSSKRIDLRVGNILDESLDLVLVSNDSKLSCTHKLASKLNEMVGAMFKQSCESVLARAGGTFAEGRMGHTAAGGDTLIKRVLHVAITSNKTTVRTLKGYYLNALNFANKEGYTCLGIVPFGSQVCDSPTTSIRALINACTEYFRDEKVPKVLKVIKVFEINKERIQNLNEFFQKANPDRWNVLSTTKDLKINKFLLEQELKKRAKEVMLQITSSDKEIWYQWSWQDDNKSFVLYDWEQNLQIETAFTNKLNKVFIVGDRNMVTNAKNYEIDFKKMIQLNSVTKFKRQIKRERLCEPIRPPKLDGTPILPALYDSSSSSSSSSSSAALPPSGSSTLFGFGLEEDDEIGVTEVDEDQEVQLRLFGPADAVYDAEKLIKKELRTRIKPLKVTLPMMDNRIKHDIEKALEGKADFTITGNDVEISCFEAHTDKIRNEVLDIALKSKDIPLPDYWSIVPSASGASDFSATLVDIKAGTPEFDRVLNQMKSTMPTVNITKLQRIQNKWLWEQYFQTKRRISTKNGSEALEMELFHGTRANPPVNIYNGQDGFDMRFSAAGMWGIGTYFAVNAKYSDDYHHPLPSGGRQIFLTRVVVGDYITTSADSSFRLPPEKPTTPGAAAFASIRYDSISGSTNGSVIFIVYANAQAYPNYLITYTP